MKKLFFFLAGALITFTATVQSAPVPQSATAVVKAQQIYEEGLCPEYYEGYLCGIFVKVYSNTMHDGITGVDPVLHVYQFRNPSNMNERTDITEKVLIDYRVWLTPEDGGTVNYDVTYKYGDGPVQHVVSHFSYL